MKIFDVINEISSTSSRLEKEAILNREKNNELLKRAFFLAYDPFTQFYQRKIPKYTPANSNQADTLDSVLDSLEMLSSRQVTGNAAIDYLTKLLSSLDESDSQVLERVISKDLKCGASESTANKIWPNLIHEYPCMLCTPMDDKVLSKFKFPAYAQLKMDGMRFNAIVVDGKCEFRSRNGKEISLMGNLEEEFINLASQLNSNVVFDGELLVVYDGNILDRQTGNGILNKAVKGTISSKEAQMVNATIWDVIDYEEFKIGRGKSDYETRFKTLENLNLTSKVRLVESKSVASIAEAQKIFDEYLAQGQEGIILKDLRGIWEDKRVKTQVKFKAELECDLRIVGIQPGTGKYEGKVGAYICESADKVINVVVGSGFSDEMREVFDVVGKIAAVKYNARIKNKQGEESLFLPILLEVREDKTDPDDSARIK